MWVQSPVVAAVRSTPATSARETSGRPVSSGPTFSGEHLGGVDDRLSELRGSELPHVVEAATHLAVCNHLEEFDYGLDLMITALELQLRR